MGFFSPAATLTLRGSTDHPSACAAAVSPSTVTSPGAPPAALLRLPTSITYVAVSPR